MRLHEWARRHNVAPAALAELLQMLTIPDPSATHMTGSSEAAVQARERLAMTRQGGRLWRNNVGALQDESGRWVRYGLCNESKEMNKLVKSSDLIGIKPILIGPQHLGLIFGQFVAREVKEGDWHYSGTGREPAQLRFIEMVLAMGGDAAFTTG